MKKTNPLLYWGIAIVALEWIGLGLNFLLPFIPAPTFRQWGIPPHFLGVAFLLIGLGMLGSLHVGIRRRFPAIRTMLTIGVGAALAWGVGTTQTFFEGTASLQLFVLYTSLAAVQVLLLIFVEKEAIGARTDA